jgi:hypothetical protein
MNKLLFSVLVLLMIGVSSCETDIDVNAEYKDTPVIYGMISPEDTVHYIKINKTFIGKGNALELAANANNFNYAAGELDVVVEEYNQSNLVKSYVLIRTENEVPKDPGIFDNSTNVLYKFIEPSINRNNTYKLKVYNKELSKEITSETSIVKGTTVSLPANPGQKFQFWIGNVGTGDFNDNTISVTTGANVGRVNAKLVFNYIEHYTIASGLDSVNKKVVMPIGETRTTTSLGNESIAWELKGETFFENIIKNVPANVAFLSHRELANISLEFSVAGTELSTFMEVSAPSNSVNQDKPSYTNINNGIGVFSSREKYTWLSSVNPASGNVNLSDNTITKLQSLGLGFCFGSSVTSSYKCTQQ